jgi:hypothetical protein
MGVGVVSVGAVSDDALFLRDTVRLEAGLDGRSRCLIEISEYVNSVVGAVRK